MSELVDRVGRYIVEEELFGRDRLVVVAVSGGLDSMVLLDLLHRLGQPLVVAHVHHGLRGAQADADEAFVRRQAEERGLPFEVEHGDVAARAQEEGRSVEEAARRLRYRRLEDVAQRTGSGVVAVAHHQTDQAETVLLNLFRGTGLEGLAGMPPSRSLHDSSAVRLVRPLLQVAQEDLVAYARERSIPWRTDATNDDVAFRRNALRHDILPLVRRHFGDAAVAKVAEAAERVRVYREGPWQDELERRFAASRCTDAGVAGLEVDALVRQPPVWRGRLVLEALARWLPEAPKRSSTADEVLSLLDAQPGRRIEVRGGTVWRERGRLRFVSETHEPARGLAALREGASVEVGAASVSARRLDGVPEDVAVGAPQAVHLDAAQLQWPLVVRSWRHGDRIQPLGMEGTRLVSDVLTDTKVPSSARARQLVVVSGEDVCWLVGHCLAHPFRVTDRTITVVRLRCEHHDEP